jgi:hypothetical protein
MVDFVKMVRKHDPGGLEADEQILAVTTFLPRASIVGAKGGTGIGGVVDQAIGQAVRDRLADHARQGAGEPVGEAATWPALDNVAAVLTDRRMVLYDAVKGLRKLLGPVGAYPLDRIAGITFEKKMMMSVARVAFADGSARELDCAMGQKLDEFVEALTRAKGGSVA